MRQILSLAQACTGYGAAHYDKIWHRCAWRHAFRVRQPVCCRSTCVASHRWRSQTLNGEIALSLNELGDKDMTATNLEHGRTVWVATATKCQRERSSSARLDGTSSLSAINMADSASTITTSQRLACSMLRQHSHMACVPNAREQPR